MRRWGGGIDAFDASSRVNGRGWHLQIPPPRVLSCAGSSTPSGPEATAIRGWVTGEERWRWLRTASLLAVPSTWPEPFGLVGLEAAALGVPTIAFDVGGVRDWLRPDENGFLVAANPPRASAFAQTLVRAFA